MKTVWKIAAPVVGVVLVCGAAIVGWHFAKVRANERKLAEDARVIRVRAEQGDAEAQFKLGVLYYQGKGVPRNYSEAFRWYQKAADQGYAKAQYNLGDLYYQGKGVKQDYSETVRWSRKAADQGYARAQAGLASMYYEGKGVKQDYSESVRWYRKAADQGEAVAQEALGYMYNRGEGVQQDYAEAARWYRKAADQGDARAQDVLGYLYYQGEGVQQDYAEAVRWYRKAADQGYARAESDLGYMYSQGKGVPQDHAEAARWYRKAAKQGEEYAQRALGAMKLRFTMLTKINLSLVFLGSILLLAGAYRAGGMFDPKQRGATTAALVGLSWVGLVVWGSFYFALLLSVSAVNGFDFAVNLLSGVCLAMHILVAWPGAARTVLKISGVLFVLFIGLRVYLIGHYHITGPAATIRLFSGTTGVWIGTSIYSTIILWLERTKTSENGNDAMVAPGTMTRSG